MSLHEAVQFDGNQFVGGTDLGGHEIGDGTARTAKEALVFMVVALNSSWRLPLGYCFVAGLNAKGRRSRKKVLYLVARPLRGGGGTKREI